MGNCHYFRVIIRAGINEPNKIPEIKIEAGTNLIGQKEENKHLDQSGSKLDFNFLGFFFGLAR